jgi:O-antigen ligase
MLLGAFLTSAAIVQSTLSRGGLAIFAAGTILVILCSLIDKPTKRRLVAVTVMGVIGSLGLVLALGTIVARFNDEGNEASSETRHLMNAAAKSMVKAHPLGIGWNNYALTINAPFPYGDVIDDGEREKGHKVDEDYAKGVVESHYYLLLSETGYQGLISYLLFIAVFLYYNFLGALRFRNHLLGCMSLGIFVSCLCNYIQSALERVLTQPRNLMLWMLLLGITARIEVWRREANCGQEPP